MASFSYQVFARRQEFLEALGVLVEEEGLRLFGDLSNARQLRPLAFEELPRLPVDSRVRIYASDRQPPPEALDASAIQPGRWGWVQLDLPVEKDRVLFPAVVAARTDWHEGGFRHDDEAAAKLYRRVVKRLQSLKRGPVIARNVQTGASGPVPNSSYSNGAIEWHRSGGLLGQEGVLNIQFEPAAYQ
jgi:hypothetical protein